MNSDPTYSQIHILPINILFLSLSFSLFLPAFSFFRLPCKPEEKDDKFEELTSGQGRMLTNWLSSLPNMGVWTSEQHLAISEWFEGRMLIGPGPCDTRQREGRIQKEENQTSQVAKRSRNRQTYLWHKE